MPPARIREATSASASPGVKIGGVIQAIMICDSSTWSVVRTRRSASNAGVVTRTGSISGPREMLPKYFSTSALVFATSMSPTIARLALLGA